MSSKLKILTLKFGDKYGPEYVNRLYSGLLRNSDCEFEFLCYTDDPKGLRPEIKIRRIHPIDQRMYRGHWLKLKFHQKGMFAEEGQKCLILDIDWVVTGNVDELLGYELKKNHFASPHRWWSNRYLDCPINGGFQMFYNGDTDHLWKIYSEDPNYWREYYYNNGETPIKGMGEQNFIWNHLEIQVDYPEWSSFGRFASDPGIQEMVESNWRKHIDPHDPYFIGDELNDHVKMVHFTSDFVCDDNDNMISSHPWIQEHWID